MHINIGKYDGTFLVKMDLFGEEITGSGQSLLKAINAFSDALVEYSKNMFSYVDRFCYLYDSNELDDLHESVVYKKLNLAKNGWGIFYSFWSPEENSLLDMYTVPTIMTQFKKQNYLRKVTLYKEYEWLYARFFFVPHKRPISESYGISLQYANEPFIEVQAPSIYDFEKRVRLAVYEQIFKHFEHMV